MKQIKVYVYKNYDGEIVEYGHERNIESHHQFIGTRTITLDEPEEKPVRERITGAYCHIYDRGLKVLRWSKHTDEKPERLHVECVELQEIRSGEKILSKDDVRRVFINSNGLEDFMNKLFGDKK